MGKAVPEGEGKCAWCGVWCGPGCGLKGCSSTAALAAGAGSALRGVVGARGGVGALSGLSCSGGEDGQRQGADSPLPGRAVFPRAGFQSSLLYPAVSSWLAS